MTDKIDLSQLTPSHEKTNVYNDLYSEFLTEFVKMYNYHVSYSINTGKFTANRLQSQYFLLQKKLKKLRVAVSESYKEENLNRKITKKKQVAGNKAAILHRKLNPKPAGRPLSANPKYKRRTRKPLITQEIKNDNN